MKYAKIAVSDVTYWVDRPYDYLVPETLEGKIHPGTRVYIPFSRGNRRAEGIVLSVSEECDYDKPKAIISLLDSEPVLTREQLEMAFWMRERFFCTVYEAVRAILPAGLWFDSAGKRKTADKTVEYVRLCVTAQDAFDEAQRRQGRAKQQAAVLRLLSAVIEAETEDVRTMTGASRTTIKALESAELVELYRKETFRRPEFRAGGERPLPQLTESQSSALEGLQNLAQSGKAGAALLHGVTGSGKTAVYIRLIRSVLDRGKTAVLLVPEIALTPQMLETFSSHFGDDVAVLHSSLSMGERYDEWKRLKSGKAHLAIGTRSAVFGPCENLGLVIIDEEQDDAYKSENSPRYHARDIAKYRCAQSNALLVLGSATPDIESRYAADTGRYTYFHLPERYNKMALPEVTIVDLKRELRAGNNTGISSFLREELQKNIENNEQSILFINRRGASKLITCVDCGYNFSCPRCSVSLTYHSANNRLVCHYCGFTQQVSSACPECGGELKYVGDGTQKIEERLGELFPDTKVLRMDTDTVSSAGSHDVLLDKFRDEHIPIMIGTQMVTKGLNFDDVTLVGVLCADQSLYCGDYRAAERTFSLITQVIGRSGRAQRPGRAVIQTYTPENEVIRLAAKQDYETFFRREAEIRRLQKCPPFTQLTMLTVTGGDEYVVLRCINSIKAILEKELSGRVNTAILGPAPYPIVRVNNKFRYKLTVSSGSDKSIRALISKLLIHTNTNREFSGVSVYADVNPRD